MSRLMDRILSVAGNPGAKKSVNQSTDLTVVGLNQAPTDIPLTRIAIYPDMISYEDLQPLVTADGAPVSATMPGSWGQLYAVGKGY